MGMVALDRRIGSAFFVSRGPHGAVTRFAQQEGVSRQWVYREAAVASVLLEGTQTRQQVEGLESEIAALREQVAHLQQRLARAVVLDEEKQAEFVCVGQGCGVSLPNCHTLLEALIPGQPLSVASLGRRSQAAGVKAGALLEVFDEYARPLVHEAAADEIYVRAPVLMVVEQESLAWVCGRLSTEVSGAAWSEELARLPNLKQLARDGGSALANGAALINAQRHEQGQEPVWEQGDHFHALRQGGVGVRKAQLRARQAIAKAEQAQRVVAQCARHAQRTTQAAAHAYYAWKKAERAMDDWGRIDRLWQQTKNALTLITPAGELNTRAKAQAVLAQTLPQLPGGHFAKPKRQLQQPEMLNYLDCVEVQLRKLPFPPEAIQAAVQQEALRRRPELLKGQSVQAAVIRGVMLVCAVVLSKVDKGAQTLAAVRSIFRRAYRASSLVECINSVLRMQQARHRKMTQGLLNLKRLYWNCHTFRTGHRRRSTPYQRLGVPWPDGLRWWDVLKLTPEQLRAKLSTTKTAA
jgi:hypothetical protein